MSRQKYEQAHVLIEHSLVRPVGLLEKKTNKKDMIRGLDVIICVASYKKGSRPSFI